MTPADPRIRGRVASNVVYLEMTRAPARRPAAPSRTGIEIRRALRPTASFYRYLYDLIGEEWTWSARRLLSDPELFTIIHHPLVEVNVLWVDGVPAGLAEIDGRMPPDVELGYFGLLPDFVGQGLGGFFLDWTVDRVWMARPRRFWVHTCDFDHPNALPVYQKAGFVVYDRRRQEELVLHDMPLPKRLGQVIEVDDIV